MERLCDLLFELSNEYRLRILFKLHEKALRLTHLSGELDLTVQETFRHLSRLSDSKLIAKSVDGLYLPTPYGEHARRLLSGFQFLSNHREYLTNHVTHHLPDEFVKRIGDLVNCTFTDEVMVALHEVEKLIQEAREYVWILSDQILMSTLPFIEQAVKRGAKFRLMLPEDFTPPSDFKPIPTIPNIIERRTLDTVDLIITMSEKRARIAFPAIERMDHIGFGTTDERSHKWCRDLFQDYWEKAKTGIPKGYPPSP